MNGEPAPCAGACPFRLDVRSLLEKTARGRWNAAYKSLRNTVVFPTIVSELCPAACESSCNRRQIGDEAIAVKQIEQICVRLTKSSKPDNFAIPPKTERIAVVGAGLAGLTAALCLAQKKYPVTVFDANEGWGGSLRAHPMFEAFDAEIDMQFSAAGAEFNFGSRISSLDELAEFDLVYAATGSGGEHFGLLPGWEPDLLTTAEPRLFMGGALTGADLAGSIMQGKALSKTAEVFLQTGKASETYGESETGRICQIDCTGETPSPRISPAVPGGYTEDEAKAESARCFQCDCDKCMASCEMLGLFRKKPKKISMEVFTDTKVNPPMSTHTITRQVYSCNMCGQCKQICPVDVDLGTLIQTSRTARVDDGSFPQALHDYWLREMEFSTGEASYHSPGEIDYLFFPGCQLGAQNPDYVIKSYQLLKKSHNIGVLLNCCGAPAYWAGETALHKSCLEQIKSVGDGAGNPVFIFACATCESLFEAFMPEIKRISLYEMLANSTEVMPAAIFDSACVFDPCNARSNPIMEQAVRELAAKSGAHLHELPEKNRCCGYGGHIRVANPQLYDTVTKNRAGMSENPYIVYCANCREVFLSEGKECIHILDSALGLTDTANQPKIDEKRRNALDVKRYFMKETSGKEYLTPTNEWDSVELVIDEKLAGEIDGKLIAASDIKEAIWQAESTGSKFIDEATGVCQCSMVKPVLTYWVQYKKTNGGAYEVYGAYYHRMRIQDF